MNSSNQITFIIPANNVEQLKQAARKLKRDQSIPHHQALDLIAQRYGRGNFQNWHHLIEAAKITALSETAFQFGLMIAFDMKDGMSFDYDLTGFVPDEQAPYFVYDDVLDMLRHELDEDGVPYHELQSDEIIKQEAHDFLGELMFFRCITDIPGDIQAALKQVAKGSFWPPQHVWLHGAFYDASELPALDEQGNVVGIRFHC